MSLARVNKSHAINFYTDFAPPSKRSLNFHDDKKAGENGLTVNGFHQNNNTTVQTKSKKRDCDELFLPLSDDDDDANGMDKLDSTPGNERLEIKVHLHDQLSCLKSYASVNSICTLPPPRPLRDICPPCQSWRWGMSKFCAAQGSGICHPWGHPGAFDMHMVSYPKI